MKIISFLFIILCLSIGTYAQAPQQLSYQAVVRNNNNVLVANSNVSVSISIAKDSANGTVVFTELHSTTTNANGLFSISIGTGLYQTGSLSAINWASGVYYIKSQIDPNGGLNFTIAGASQLLSVPYALYAANGNTNGNNAGDMQYWDGTKWAILSAGSNGSVMTICNGVPTWGGCPTSGLPVVQTISATPSVDRAPGTGSGAIISAGGSPITAEGLCWSMSPNPTLGNDNYASATALSPDTFFVNIFAMTSYSTTYYVRAYATNSYGTSYGNQLTLTTIANPYVSIPTLQTLSATAPINGNSGIAYGYLTNVNGAFPSSQGFCWSANPNPTIADSIATGLFTTQDSFYANYTSMAAGGTYYLRAFATNSAGTGYGNQVTVTVPNSGFKNFYIGESYGGGIIFYIDGTGQHGLIAANSDAEGGAMIPWDVSVNSTYATTNATDTTIGGGLANTNTIISVLGVGTYAAFIASQPVNGFSDWYMPSKAELELIYANLTQVGLGNMQQNYYWSSSEADKNEAWAESFFSPLSSTNPFKDAKSSSAFVRPIRKF